jgi:hypothetical protein
MHFAATFLLPASAAVLALAAGGCSSEAAGPDRARSVAQALEPNNPDSNVVLVLVHPNVAAGLADELATFEQDLRDEGWDPDVVEYDNPDLSYLRYYLSYTHFRASLAGALLVGDLPYARCARVDSASYQETGPCDLYLMDLDGEWRDDDGDGAFDFHGAGADGDRQPEIFIGRLHGSNVDLYGRSELEMFEDYFARNHAFRKGLSSTRQASLYNTSQEHHYGLYDPASAAWSQAVLDAQAPLFPETQVLLYDHTQDPWPAELWEYSDPSDKQYGLAADMFAAELGSGLDYASVGSHGWAQGWGGLMDSQSMASLVEQGGQLPILIESHSCANAGIHYDNCLGAVATMGNALVFVGPSENATSLFEWDVALRQALATETIGQAVMTYHDFATQWFGPEVNLLTAWTTSARLLLGDPTLKLRYQQGGFVNPNNLEVWIADEGSNCQSTAFRLYVKNAGSQPVSNFVVRYTFSIAEDAGKTVGLQDNYTPWSRPRVENVGGSTRVVALDFAGRTLRPGRVTSWGAGGGEKVRVHFTDWACTWDESNDYSAEGKTYTFSTTELVDVYDSNGNLIYGYQR